MWSLRGRVETKKVLAQHPHAVAENPKGYLSCKGYGLRRMGSQLAPGFLVQTTRAGKKSSQDI